MRRYFRQKMRTFISIVLGLIDISAAVFLSMGLINSKQRPKLKAISKTNNEKYNRIFFN
jgi:hypothetical protein